jgi:hypothetical protein
MIKLLAPEIIMPLKRMTSLSLEEKDQKFKDMYLKGKFWKCNRKKMKILSHLER